MEFKNLYLNNKEEVLIFLNDILKSEFMSVTYDYDEVFPMDNYDPKKKYTRIICHKQRGYEHGKIYHKTYKKGIKILKIEVDDSNWF